MTKTSIPALALAAVISVIGTFPAEAQTYTVPHNFAGPPADGENPSYGRLVGDSGGNLYGTTRYGGASGVGFAGGGVVFRLDSSGKETVLHSFAGPDGEVPSSGLLRDSAGNLYGTALGGGTAGFGVVFKQDSAGKEIVLHSFAGSPVDGAFPAADLIRDFAGNLYGTTQNGGTSGFGVVFKLDPTGTETVLHSFAGGSADGAIPQAGMIGDFAGNLYGTTSGGGTSGMGVVFKVDSTGKETILHSFAGGPVDGPNPFGRSGPRLCGQPVRHR